MCTLVVTPAAQWDLRTPRALCPSAWGTDREGSREGQGLSRAYVSVPALAGQPLLYWEELQEGSLPTASGMSLLTL